MSTSTLGSPDPFGRRVSFNCIHPEYIDDPGGDDPGRFRTAFLIDTQGDANFGYGQTRFDDVSKIFSGLGSAAASTFGVSTPSRAKVRYRLPDPPAKSILKTPRGGSSRRASAPAATCAAPAAASSSAIAETSSDSSGSDEREMRAWRQQVAAADGRSTSSSPPSSQQSGLLTAASLAGPGRQKSFSEMTDEELMELDPQYKLTKPRPDNLHQFKFDSQNTYWPSARRASLPSTSRGGRFSSDSSSSNNYNSISLTVQHKSFVPSNRTIMAVISGRRHSWNALDALVTSAGQEDSLLANGDYLVVASLVPARYFTEYGKNRCGSTGSGASGAPPSAAACEESLSRRCDRLLSYITSRLHPGLAIKVTVEFVTDYIGDNQSSSTGFTWFEGSFGNTGSSSPLSSSFPGASGSAVSSGGQGMANGAGYGSSSSRSPKSGYKYMLPLLYNQYQPTIVVVGTRSSNLNFKYPFKLRRNTNKARSVDRSLSAGPLSVQATSSPAADEFMIKLASFLIKYSSVPVVVVGNTCKAAQNGHNVIYGEKKMSVTSSQSEESISSESKGPNAYRAETKCSTLADDSLKSDVCEMLQSDSESRFADALTAISDRSHNHSVAYLSLLKSRETGSSDAAQSEGISLDVPSVKYSDATLSKIHTIYSSQQLESASQTSNKDRLYKVKSMISYDEGEEERNARLRQSRQRSRGSIATYKSVDSAKGRRKSDSSIVQSTSSKKKPFWKRFIPKI
ncbi:Piso0_000111 [Millerozyma farinosa CBS 7064]|uniref:Piso0_000111 protein n=1 Tax=Pichia sorbitophila (strain ATCC MYA-4447 / BCRC 22081 / CBS 7064 / NBRC 10061 / NRRL Y-12695) TaxID=559304 RepID=G8YUJ6_PICSO|nr:Piso0_000111 [Millerozyma farinosa CBS 7064]